MNRLGKISDLEEALLYIESERARTHTCSGVKVHVLWLEAAVRCYAKGCVIDIQFAEAPKWKMSSFNGKSRATTATMDRLNSPQRK